MLDAATQLILTYRYWAILAFSLVEAPLMSIVIGFFIVTGYLNLYISFGIVVLGDFIGDTVLYVLGRWHRPLFNRLGGRLNFSNERVRKVLAYFGKRDQRAIVISKLVHGVGFTGLIVAGSLRMPFRRFILTCVVVSTCQSAVLTAVGMLSGRAYQSFAHLLGYFDVIVSAIALIVIFLLYGTFVGKISDGKAKD